MSVDATSPAIRLTVAFDADTATAYVPRGKNAGKKFGTVTHFVEKPRETPTGGKYISRQFTLTLAGQTYYGTCGKDVDRRGFYIVKCRPAK